MRDVDIPGMDRGADPGMAEPAGSLIGHPHAQLEPYRTPARRDASVTRSSERAVRSEKHDLVRS